MFRKEAALAALKAHLAKRGYDSIQSSADAPLIQAQRNVLERRGIKPLLRPRNADSYPGFVFTDSPLSLASGHFGLGLSSGAHAPDEHCLIESTSQAVQRYDGR